MDLKINLDYLETPVGWLLIEADSIGICRVSFLDDKKEDDANPSSITSDCIGQLKEYFAGKRTAFSLPLNFSGTDFQKKVWSELMKIPYGKTISYQELALRLGDDKVIRAAGTANGKNPVAIIVPCHRVIGSDGTLVGYTGGLWRKKMLLEFEAGKKQAALF